MPLPTSEIAHEINRLFKENQRFNDGASFFTMPWPEFYELCEIERFKEPRAEEIQKEVSDQYGLIVAYGNRIVLISEDRNFAPMKRR